MSTDPYAANIVKEYRYWTVYVHTNQQFLGRCVIWCKREDAEDLALSTDEERTELFVILEVLRAALATGFGATWFNYAFLGNVDRHLHCHLVPRYKVPVTFDGIAYTDPGYDQNSFKLEKKFETPREMLDAVRDRLKEML